MGIIFGQFIDTKIYNYQNKIQSLFPTNVHEINPYISGSNHNYVTAPSRLEVIFYDQ